MQRCSNSQNPKLRHPVDAMVLKLGRFRVYLDRTYFVETENWKHCSKIILNVWIVLWDPFLMKKWLKSEVCGSVNSALMHCLRENSQKLRLLFMNSSRNTTWSSWNMCQRKKKVKRKYGHRISVSKSTLNVQ